jgi:hypothetical protein
MIAMFAAIVPRTPETRRKVVHDVLDCPLRKVEVKINTGFRAAGPG